jgi:hypothetical protein
MDHPHAFLKIQKPEDSPLSLVVGIIENEKEIQPNDEGKEESETLQKLEEQSSHFAHPPPPFMHPPHHFGHPPHHFGHTPPPFGHPFPPHPHAAHPPHHPMLGGHHHSGGKRPHCKFPGFPRGGECWKNMH